MFQVEKLWQTLCFVKTLIKILLLRRHNLHIKQTHSLCGPVCMCVRSRADIPLLHTKSEFAGSSLLIIPGGRLPSLQTV